MSLGILEARQILCISRIFQDQHNPRLLSAHVAVVEALPNRFVPLVCEIKLNGVSSCEAAAPRFALEDMIQSMFPG